MRKNILLAVISIFITLALTESIFRLLDIRGYYLNRTRDWKHAIMPIESVVAGISSLFKPYSQFELNYDSNPSGYFNENSGIIYKMNKYGLRGADFDKQKKAGTKRVIVLGDSFTIGEGVKLKDTFCVRLQNVLERDLKLEIEVLNFGVSAFNTKLEIKYFENFAIKFQPDLVIVVSVLNDANNRINVWDKFRKQYEAKEYKFSYLLSFIIASINWKKLTDDYVTSMVDSSLEHEKVWNKKVFKPLLRAKRLAESVDSQYMVAIFPFMYDFTDSNPLISIHRMIYDYCLSNDINALDLFDSFKGKTDKDFWAHPSDPHPNHKAHKIAGEAMAKFIIANKLILKE